MTTQHTDYEQNDVDATVVEHPFSPDTAVSSTATEMPSPTEGEVSGILPLSAEQNVTQNAEQGEAPVPQAEVEMTEVPSTKIDMTETGITETGVKETGLTEASMAFPFIGEVPLGAEPGGVRSFADYIEEFRQTEARHNASLQGSQETFSLLTTLSTDVDTLYQAPAQSDTPIAPSPETEADEVPAMESPSVEEKVEMAPASIIPPEEQATEVSTPVQAVDETAETQPAAALTSAQPVAPPTPQPAVERPVSPLLRPATRLRLPRHGSLRQREEESTAATSQPSSVAPEVPPTPQEAIAPTEPGTEQAKPTRRYRFDRPSTSSTSSSQPQRSEENREKDQVKRNGPTTPGRPENGQSNGSQVTEPVTKQTVNGNPPTHEQQSTKLQEPVTLEASETERSRWYGQDRHQEPPSSAPPTSSTGQAVPVSSVAPATLQPEMAASTLSAPPAPQPEEIAPEDLPPLEYSELQKANSRRRRRHRASPNNGSSVTSSGVKPTPQEASAPITPPVTPTAGGTSPAPAMPSIPATPTRASNNATAPVPQYNLVSGYTLNQMNQGNDQAGPFMGPEPSPARGSVSTRDGRNVRAEAQRSPVYPVRSPDVIPSTTSIHQLGSILTQAIQTQTDRMVAELRRVNQAPSNISVTLPPFPSTERVGVFVDVANLLYSARTLRIAVNFGKLLDFLRGNRRLVRAHAYCPTSPQPSEDQMFLQAVKGLGYRITTKHYKTFASGARKADLDLDLCMDVVRLVEGRAIDCVVLVSGDSDFMPMLDYCSDHGVRVEVAAFDEAMSATLRQSCDLFINLSMLEEIRS